MICYILMRGLGRIMTENAAHMTKISKNHPTAAAPITLPVERAACTSSIGAYYLLHSEQGIEKNCQFFRTLHIINILRFLRGAASAMTFAKALFHTPQLNGEIYDAYSAAQ